MAWTSSESPSCYLHCIVWIVVIVSVARIPVIVSDGYYSCFRPSFDSLYSHDYYTWHYSDTWCMSCSFISCLSIAQHVVDFVPCCADTPSDYYDDQAGEEILNQQRRSESGVPMTKSSVIIPGTREPHGDFTRFWFNHLLFPRWIFISLTLFVQWP